MVRTPRFHYQLFVLIAAFDVTHDHLVAFEVTRKCLQSVLRTSAVAAEVEDDGTFRLGLVDQADKKISTFVGE